jgi:hypothetical protein
MSLEEMGREFRMYLNDALGDGENSDEAGSMPNNAEDKAYERMGVSGRKIDARKLSADDREELNQTAGIARGELIDDLLDANPKAEVRAKNSKGQIVVTKKNLSAPLPAEDAKNYTKDREAALKAFGDVRNHIYALEIAVNMSVGRGSNKELESELGKLKDDVTSWKAVFDNAGDTPTIRGAIKMKTEAMGLGETIKYHMGKIHEKTGWKNGEFQERGQNYEYALQSAADKNFGVTPQKYNISDAIYRTVEQEDWA